MRNALLVSAFGLALIAQPALAATVTAPAPKVTFADGVFAVPTYTTATVFQDFEKSIGYTGSVGTASATGGKLNNALVKGSPPVGSDLQLGKNTYTVDFAAPVQFLSFIAKSPLKSTATINFANATSTTFDLAKIAGGAGNSSAGLFIFDMLGQSGITSVAITGGTGNFRLDDFAAAAPEPATWAMMIFGFGAVGAAMRRRKVTTKVSFA